MNFKILTQTYRGRKVLVTGHTGFKGAWLCRWLKKLGAEVAGFSLGKVSEPSLFEELSLEKGLKHFEGDVRELDSLQKVFHQFQPEVVFHLAAESLVRRSYDDPPRTFGTNVMGTVNVLEVLRKMPSVKAAVIVTTDKVYENAGGQQPFKEGDRLGGQDPYSASKACAEMVTSSYFQSFFKGKNLAAIATARAGNVIGGGDWSLDRILPDCVRAWNQSQPVILRHPEHIRPWQHVLEPLSGYLWLAHRLLEKDSQIEGQSFNFGPQKSHSMTVESLVSEFQRHWPQAPGKKIEREGEKKEAHAIHLDCDKAARLLDWRSVLSFSQTVEMTAVWYREFEAAKSSASEITDKQIETFGNVLH